MNGQGDKWRGGWSQQFANNDNKIFGEKMKDVKDGKNIYNLLKIQETKHLKQLILQNNRL